MIKDLDTILYYKLVNLSLYNCKITYCMTNQPNVILKYELIILRGKIMLIQFTAIFISILILCIPLFRITLILVLCLVYI